jgi:hypothetical protein
MISFLPGEIATLFNDGVAPARKRTAFPEQYRA